MMIIYVKKIPIDLSDKNSVRTAACIVQLFIRFSFTKAVKGRSRTMRLAVTNHKSFKKPLLKGKVAGVDSGVRDASNLPAIFKNIFEYNFSIILNLYDDNDLYTVA